MKVHRTETLNGNMECKIRKTEVGSRKSEDGTRELETRNLEIETLKETA
jgi:hypothetical protein